MNNPLCGWTEKLWKKEQARHRSNAENAAQVFLRHGYNLICPFCLYELPDIRLFHRHLRQYSDFALLSMCIALANEQPKPYPQVVICQGRLAIIPASRSITMQGTGLGHRAAHCTKETPFSKTGYILVPVNMGQRTHLRHPRHIAAKAQAPVFSPEKDGAASLRAPPIHASNKTATGREVY